MTETSERGRGLAGLLEPRSVALLGATEKNFWSQTVIRIFREFGAEMPLYAVNRRGEDVLGAPGFASCQDIRQPVDLAYLMLPQDAILDGLGDAAAAGIRNAVVLSSGYAEAGEEGARLQAELVARAKALGMLIWGPNSLGFNNFSSGALLSTMEPSRPLLPPRPRPYRAERHDRAGTARVRA